MVIAVADEFYENSMVTFVSRHNSPERTEFHLINVVETNLLNNPLLLPMDVVSDLRDYDRRDASIIIPSVGSKIIR